jgi:riboflavin kinase/FMN adenylyltransferase
LLDRFGQNTLKSQSSPEMDICRHIPSAAAGPCALTIGNFDGIHRGHQAMLARLTEAARDRHLPVTVMTFEPHPREFFTPDGAPTRLTSLREKLELLQGYGVDRVQVCRFDRNLARMTPDEFIERILRRGLACRYLLIGDDFRFGARRAGDFAMLEQAAGRCGFEVEAMASFRLDGVRVSSTAVREALAAGDLDHARKLLGRDYAISGRVVAGDRLGRELGFPTANIRIRHNRPPLWGIYAVQVHVPGRAVLPGVASLGTRPTVTSQGKPQLEVHLLDFDDDLYGSHMKVEFLAKFRDEERYADLDALKRQIAQDVENAKDYFLND